MDVSLPLTQHKQQEKSATDMGNPWKGKGHASSVYLLSPDVALSIVHRHESSARVEVEHDLLEVLVVLGAYVDAPRPAVRRDRHAHHQGLVLLLLGEAVRTTGTLGDSEVF